MTRTVNYHPQGTANSYSPTNIRNKEANCTCLSELVVSCRYNLHSWNIESIRRSKDRSSKRLGFQRGPHTWLFRFSSSVGELGEINDAESGQRASYSRDRFTKGPDANTSPAISIDYFPVTFCAGDNAANGSVSLPKYNIHRHNAFRIREVRFKSRHEHLKSSSITYN